VVQVDLDPTAPGRHLPVDLGVHGDVAEVADRVRALVTARPGRRTDELRDRIAAGIRWRDVPYQDLSTDDEIDPRTATVLLDDLLPSERVVSVDSGNFMGYPSMFLSVPDERGFCFTQAYQSIGLGLATAVGAALAQPHRLPVAALGDGGALMGISELETVVRLGIPLVVVVYNDAAYGAEVHHFGPEAATCPWCASRPPTSPRSPAATGSTPRPCGVPRTSTRSPRGWRVTAPAPSWSISRSSGPSPPGGWRRRSAGTEDARAR
jgi:hypothetical protein